MGEKLESRRLKFLIALILAVGREKEAVAREARDVRKEAVVRKAQSARKTKK